MIGRSKGLTPPSFASGAQSGTVPINWRALGRVVRGAALQAGFRQVDFEDGEQGRFVGLRRTQTQYLRNVGETTLLVRWIPESHTASLVEWVAYRQPGYGVGFDSAAMQSFVSAFTYLIATQPRAPRPPLRDPIVLPGQRPPIKYQGDIWDYSALAPVNALDDLRHGVLPLGRWAFGWQTEAHYGPQLYLPRIDSVPVEERGVLICAPQGSGKTHLLVRWAAAAIRAGRSVFLVDVKGNLLGHLKTALARFSATPDIIQFTTAPRAASDRINFLSGINAGQIDATEQLYRLAAAILPGGDLRGEEVFRHEIAVRLATASMKVLKLMHWYTPADFVTPDGSRRDADLADLLELVESEQKMMSWIDWIREKEAWELFNERQPRANYPIEECVTALAIALGQEYPTLQPPAKGKGPLERKPFAGGQRPREFTYIQYMLPLIKALEPFRPNGPMGPRIRSFGPGKEFRFENFGKPGKAVVVLLTAREQDSALATAVLGMAVRRLRNTLDERRNQPGPRGEVLLLLDETRRIVGFDPVDFVTVIRDGQVGYVLVYQELSLIDPAPEKVGVVLANIGTQIYLQAISGHDLDRFNKQFFERRRERLKPNTSRTAGGRQTGTTLEVETVPFLESRAAYHLPGGVRPALVYIRGGPPPFVVDLHQGHGSQNGQGAFA